MGSGFEQISRGQRTEFNEEIRFQDHQSPRGEIRKVPVLQRYGVGWTRRSVRPVRRSQHHLFTRKGRRTTLRHRQLELWISGRCVRKRILVQPYFNVVLYSTIVFFLYVHIFTKFVFFFFFCDFSIQSIFTVTAGPVDAKGFVQLNATLQRFAGRTRSLRGFGTNGSQ